MCNKKINFHPSLSPSIILKLCSLPSMAYPNQNLYNYYHGRPFAHSHQPSSSLGFHDYNQLTISSFSSHPSIWCLHCHNSSHFLEQYLSIRFSLGLNQNQFHTFQGSTSEPCPSNFSAKH